MIIHLDYQSLIKRLKLAWKTKDVLLAPHYWSYQNVGFVKMIYEFASIDGGLESVCFTLEGDGPLFLLDNRTLRMVSKVIRPFKWEGVGSIVNLNGLRLRVVAEMWNGFEHLVMLPNTWAVIFYYLFPISRWFDKIYRRLILTAAVWGLADCPAAEIPYWGHLKWVKRETNE